MFRTLLQIQPDQVIHQVFATSADTVYGILVGVLFIFLVAAGYVIYKILKELMGVVVQNTQALQGSALAIQTLSKQLEESDNGIIAQVNSHTDKKVAEIEKAILSIRLKQN